MGLLSFLSRRKRSHQAITSQQEIDVPIIKPSWHHSIENFTLVTDPLGQMPGTNLERDLIYSILYSLAQEISTLQLEGGDATSSDLADLARLISAKAALEEITMKRCDVVGLMHDAALGFAARVSANSKKYTVLLGDVAPVARASTPFHTEIATFAEVPSDASSTRISRKLILAIDGIAYLALTFIAELR